MEPANITLNPGVRQDSITPLCPDCGDKIVEVSSESENRFMCGCDRLRKFEFSE